MFRSINVPMKHATYTSACEIRSYSLQSTTTNFRDWGNTYRLQHCLEWVMRVYTSKLTSDSVLTYLFHDCELSLWVFCLVWHMRACDDQSTVHLDWQEATVLRACAIFEGLTEFCFVFRFGFRASFLDFMSRIERLYVCYYYIDIWSVFSVFCSDYSRARPSAGRSGQVRSSTACVCRSFRSAPIAGRSAQPWHAADKLSAVSYDPLSHSRHNAGDRSTKAGHEIK